MKATKFSQFLQDREELQFVDRPHWIYIVEAVIWSAILILGGFFIHNLINDYFIFPRLENNIYADGFFLNVAAYASLFFLWGSVVFAALYFISMLIFWASTYVFASDRRLYMKTGLIRVLVYEVSFDEIRKTDINYGLLGRFLGYGKMVMDARFVEDTELPYIYHPETFQKIIHNANDLAGDINISYVTDNMPDEAEKILPKQSDAQDQVKPMRQHKKYLDESMNKQESHIDEKEMTTHASERPRRQKNEKDIQRPASTRLKTIDI